jgi:predicted nucleic acid-binding Zn ribbon protein
MECKFCGEEKSSFDFVMETGKRKREDAEFCSEKCRNDYHNMRKKQKRHIEKIEGLMMQLQEMRQVVGTTDAEQSLVSAMTSFIQYYDMPEELYMRLDHHQLYSNLFSSD